MRLLINNATILPHDERKQPTNILCENGRIKAIGSDVTASDAQVIDATDCVVFPTLIDLHAHVGEPGHEARETVATLGEAAVRGGFGTVVVMPDTTPPRQTVADVYGLQQLAAQVPCRILPAAALTKERAGKEPTEWGELAEAGVPAFADCTNTLDNSLLRRALTYLKTWQRPLFVDCVDPHLSDGASGRESLHGTMYGLRGMPAEAEEIAIAQALIVAQLTKGHVHIQRVSTKQGLQRIAEAKQQGLSVTAEVSWLHLLQTDAALEHYDTSLKVWPPLGTEEDRQALLAGVRTGIIDAIVTDHTPYTIEEKDVEFDWAPWGAAGVEHALPALWSQLVTPGHVEADTLIERLTSGPASVINMAKPHIAEDEPAQFVVFKPEHTAQSIAHRSLAANHPYAEHKFTAHVQATVIDGQVRFAAGRSSHVS